MENWVDFRAVKQGVSMEMVLGRYGVELRRANKTSLRGRCPLPAHGSDHSKDSFGVNTEKSIWACQSSSCVKARAGRKGGNVLDFVAAMEQCSVRDAALKIQTWFGVAGVATEKKATPAPEQLVAGGKEGSEPARGTGLIENAVNLPLTFTLKGVDPSHPYLAERGIEQGIAEYFGVGFFRGKGLMSGRVVVPIHNERESLVAYAGRSIDGAEPKYKLPAGFRKSLVLFNLHRALRTGQEAQGRVVVVEGFFDCMKVVQAGFPATVALMGNTLSAAQEALLLAHFREVVLMLDGDEAGLAAAEKIAGRLVHQFFVCVVDLPAGAQPDRLSSEVIRELLQSP